MDIKRQEWNALSENERNCLMWPDFLMWNQAHCDVEIHRNDPSDSLGLVSVTVQDEDTKLWYNVTKRIKENHPAHGHVNPYEWIFMVDGTTTTNCPSDKFSNLVRNGKKVVHLSLKKPVDSLAKFVKKWGAEKIVTLKLSKETDFQKRCRLVHFYSKDDTGIHTKDRILVWEVKPGTETSEPILHRGDELLEVDGQRVLGEKLADIYKRIIDRAPADVELKIQEIQHDLCNVKEMAPIAILPEFENRLNSPDTSIVADNPDPVFDEPTQCIVVEKEMDMNAGRIENEVHVNSLALEDSFEIQSPEAELIGQPQGGADSPDIQKSTQESKTKQKRPSLTKRLSWRRSSSGSKAQSEEAANGDEGNDSVSPSSAQNAAYSFTPPTQRKSLMCGECLMKRVTQLPDDRDNWPIHKIESGYIDEIRKLLDLEDRSNKSLLVALGCFSTNEADSIKQEFKPGGCGMAKKALGIWGTSKYENNVGAFKKILQDTMRRVDVLDEIENWKMLPVCHGCGVKLS